MPKFNAYLNFDGKAEEAFNFYKSIFGGEFAGGVMKMGDAPGTEGISESEKNRVMHVALPITGGDYFGSFKDKYGVCWMISYSNREAK
jgi:PhnB protein